MWSSLGCLHKREATDETQCLYSVLVSCDYGNITIIVVGRGTTVSFLALKWMLMTEESQEPVFVGGSGEKSTLASFLSWW